MENFERTTWHPMIRRRRLMHRAIVTGVLIMQAGCSSYDRFILGALDVVEQGSRAGTAPTFAAVEGAWPAVPINEGRLVLFSSVTNVTRDAIGVTIDGQWETSLSPWRFLFIDLPVGEHLIRAKYRRSAHPLGVSVTTASDRLTFVSILDSAPPLILEDSDARRILRKCHHEYAEPLPYDEQKTRSP